MTIIEGRKYSKFDLHVHTAETSKCGIVSAPDLVRSYKAAGYDGVVITDHMHETYISLQNCRDDWQECVTRYLFGYQEAKRVGDEIGLTVALGVELRFPVELRLTPVSEALSTYPPAAVQRDFIAGKVSSYFNVSIVTATV